MQSRLSERPYPVAAAITIGFSDSACDSPGQPAGGVGDFLRTTAECLFRNNGLSKYPEALHEVLTEYS